MIVIGYVMVAVICGGGGIVVDVVVVMSFRFEEHLSLRL